MDTPLSQAWFDRARIVIPGGVNSPVRAFKSVGGTPRFMAKGAGPFLWDVDGQRYIDYVLSWGPLILGHAHPSVVEALQAALLNGTSYGAPTPLEVDLADLILSYFPSMEMIRFVNSGTEATMSALRLARASTQRHYIIKFDGCYHGHADLLLVQAGSGVATLGLPDSAGVPSASTAYTLSLPYNDLNALEACFQAYPDQIAAVIVEPIAANMGFVLPDADFLPAIQRLCQESGTLFILDEVMTGFRAAMPGAQTLWGLDPDLTCLGKVIGGGLPVGAYGGKRAIMQQVAPIGPVYQAGTLSGNPLAMVAGLASLQTLAQPGIFEAISQQTQRLAAGLQHFAIRSGFLLQVGSVGTMFGFYFLKTPDGHIRDYASAKAFVDSNLYARFFHLALEQGLYFAPSPFEAGFLSSTHDESIISDTLSALDAIFIALIEA
jgi:glutamate-1-semialdehyde 2,1-aminomutase